jgi:protein phosphatase
MTGERYRDRVGGPKSGPYPSLWEFPPPAAIVQVTFGARSQIGPGNAVNEDHYAIFQASRSQEMLVTSLPEGESIAPYREHGYAMVVADGLGRDGSGEAASRIAIATLWHLFIHLGKWNLRIDEDIARDIMDRARRFYRHVDAAVVHQGRSGPSPAPQTTLTAICGAGRDLFIAHVGHSRAYLSRDKVLMRLTRDHTLSAQRASRIDVAPLVDMNQAAHDLRHILINAIGMKGQAGPTIDVERFQILDDDRVLVCTNGLTDAVAESQIAEVLASDRTPDDMCRTLVESAVSSEGADDVTVLAARYRTPH